MMLILDLHFNFWYPDDENLYQNDLSVSVTDNSEESNN